MSSSFAQYRRAVLGAIAADQEPAPPPLWQRDTQPVLALVVRRQPATAFLWPWHVKTRSLQSVARPREQSRGVLEA